jgi:hypothetical protein
MRSCFSALFSADSPLYSWSWPTRSYFLLIFSFFFSWFANFFLYSLTCCWYTASVHARILRITVDLVNIIEPAEAVAGYSKSCNGASRWTTGQYCSGFHPTALQSYLPWRIMSRAARHALVHLATQTLFSSHNDESDPGGCGYSSS